MEKPNTQASAPTTVRHVNVPADQAGQRIDNFLARELKGLPRTRLYRLLRKGEVRVNKGRVQPSFRLNAGDTVRIPPVQVADSRPGPGKAPEGLLDELEAAILHEDKHLMVLNKPAGLAVHGGSGLRFGLIEALRQRRSDCRFLELVHRLDRDTSGCLLIAKKRSELRRLHTLLRGNAVEKRYWALLAGTLPRGPVPVEAALDRSGKKLGGQVQVAASGKASRSVFRRLEVFRHANCTLADVQIETGRTHQVRVHAAHIGHPVIGDVQYGDPERNREFRGLGQKRLFLHAAELRFFDPDADAWTGFRAPLPTDLQQILDNLRTDPATGGVRNDMEAEER
ncbi:RluA family pseudouridine synthase [Methylonatrum kenyense]|uniref:RluA family pseudouridine synthase n=1 Tax=Methylonatrum kenyense TaxID=455253 RepID=UPI0020BE2622|nr:RluA family pseudouridine synthase [Methylonatrum kenyense]